MGMETKQKGRKKERKRRTWWMGNRHLWFWTCLCAWMVWNATRACCAPETALDVRETWKKDQGNKHVLVGLVDGTVHAVEDETGRILWSFASGEPLVSSSNTKLDGNEKKEAVVPGADGSMYLYSQTDGTYKKMPLTAQEIVSNTPSLTHGRTSVILGSRNTKVFALHPITGKLLQTIDSEEEKESQDNQVLMKKQSEELKQAVFVGRTEYRVRSVDVITGQELWNVSYAELSQIDRTSIKENDMFLAGWTDIEAWKGGDEHDFFAGYDNTLRKVCKETGKAKWIVKFRAPLVSGFSGDDGGNVHKFLPTSKKTEFAGPDQIDQLIIGTVNQQIYALPTKHLVLFEEDLEGNDKALVATSALNDPWECVAKEIVEVGELDDCVAHPMLPMLPMLPTPVDEGKLQIPDQFLSQDPKMWFALALAIFLIAVGTAFFFIYLTRARQAFGAPLKELSQNLKLLNEVENLPSNFSAQSLNHSNGGISAGRIVNEDGSFQVGRMEVGPGILGFGSGGTIVYEGKLDGRMVAVKRLLHQFYSLAKKEIEALIQTDENINVVRCFAMEEDSEFVYLALEKCVGTLATVLDPFHADSGSQSVSGKQRSAEEAMNDLGIHAELKQTSEADFPFKLTDLYNAKIRCPTELCMSAMQSIAAGVAALHTRGIVHRDLKPHNVLVTKDGKVKLSDMGLSKMLKDEQSSFENTGTSGSSGWRAPEQILYGRQTKSVDIFSMGCLLFYCFTGGRHAFGARLERDINIARGKRDLSAVEHLPEVHDLLVHLLAPEPSDRPAAESILMHPVWWTPDIKLQFLCDVSDVVEHQNKTSDTKLLLILECFSSTAIGKGGWDKLLSSELLANLGQFRKYNYSSVRDLLRVIRNKKNHYQELPEELQEHLGHLPRGYLEYFTSRYPNLLLEMYSFVTEHCADMPIFSKYFDLSLSMNGPPFSITRVTHESLGRAEGESLAPALPDAVQEEFPQRPGQPPCSFYLKTGTCKYGKDCRFHHPKEGRVRKNSAGLPIRPGAPECQHYIKTGLCKFGAMCKFHHPEI